MRPISLSKSLILKGRQCEKNLFLHVYHRNLAAKITPSQQALFDQGYQVGLEAQKRFPGGRAVVADYWDTAGAVEQTKDLIKGGANIIFEATFVREGVSARVDVLVRNGDGSYDVIEVKSGTSVKDENLDDVAVQVWVLEGAGFKVRKAFVMFINKECTAPDLENLFSQEDVTEAVRARAQDLFRLVAKFMDVLKSKTPPKIGIGPRCDEPYECSFRAHCWKDVPKPSIFDLPGLYSDVWKYYERGILTLDDVTPEKLSAGFGPQGGTDLVLPDKAERALQVHRSGHRHVDRTSIQKELAGWKFPLSYLDFETIAFAIPRYRGSRPFEQVPFQFSLHVEPKLGAALSHAEFLHTSPGDPREALIEAMLSALPKDGSIVAYNKKFEQGCIQRLATAFPAREAELTALLGRFVDPLPLFQNFVYDEKFQGSFSIKFVAPALLGDKLSYKGMTVGDGEAAQRAFLDIINPKSPPARKTVLTRGLLEYCKQDTLAMVELVHWLYKQN